MGGSRASLRHPAPGLRQVAAAVVGSGLAMVSAAPAAAARAAELPDLVVTAAFDKATYVLNEAATATFTIRNASAVTATNIHVTGSDSAGFTLGPVPALGFDLAPGEVRTVTYPGTVNQFGHSFGFMHYASGFGSGPGDEKNDANPDDNDAVAGAKVLGAKGSVHGKVFHEADGDDSTVDPEGIPGTVVKLYDQFTPTVLAFSTTSGADGLFQFTDIPVGDYLLKVALPPGWQLLTDSAPQNALVTDGSNGEDPDVNIPVVPAPIPTATATPVPAPPLAVTGSPTALIAGIGLAALVAGGLLLLLLTRRRAPR